MRVGGWYGIAVGLLLMSVVPGAGGIECGGEPYARALCRYQAGEWSAAATELEAIVKGAEPGPELIRSWYFLGRVRMAQHRWRDAERTFITIFTMDRAFYDEWNCDYLLGECRRALGKD